MLAGALLALSIATHHTWAEGADEKLSQDTLKKVLPVAPHESGLVMAFGPEYAGRSVTVKDARGKVVDLAKFKEGAEYQVLRYRLEPGPYQLDLPAGKGKVNFFAEPGEVGAISIGVSPRNEAFAAIKSGEAVVAPPVALPAGKQFNFTVGNGGTGTDDPGPSTMR